MNENYLWDRTGEPDPEVQQLEEILGTLRHQGRPLEIPADLQVDRPRSFFRDFGPRLAIAATIAMLLLGLGVWLGMRRLQRAQPAHLAVRPKAPEGSSNPSPLLPPKDANNEVAVSPTGSDRKSIDVDRHRVSQRVVARNSNRLRNQPANNSQLAAREQEGRAAKDQLMLALRLASTKLNLAQKKTQNINSRELIHNQHKIG
jgi:hypothetical protein